MIHQAKRRLARWPRVRLTLVTISAVSFILAASLYSVALRFERPDPHPMSMNDRFICVALSTLFTVIALICLSKAVVNWRGNKIDKFLVTLADKTEQTEEASNQALQGIFQPADGLKKP